MLQVLLRVVDGSRLELFKFIIWEGHDNCVGIHTRPSGWNHCEWAASHKSQGSRQSNAVHQEL
jgi:hypothetical protein